MTLSLLAQAGDSASPGGAIGWLWLTIALPLAGFLINGWLSVRRSRTKAVVSFVGPAVLFGAFAVSLAAFIQLQGLHAEAPIVQPLWSWMPVGNFQIDFALQYDQLSAIMLLVITGVGSLIHLYSVGYMRSDEGYARYFAYLNFFVVAMLVLVLGSSYPVLFIGWEGVGLASYLLIGFWFGDKANADAGLKAFLVNRIGDFGFLVAMFMLWHAAGTLTFTAVTAWATAHPELAGSGAITAIALFMFLGCAGKSAQIPLYTWLPDAMAGPTPVSALIHAATMVTAGVYLVVRSNVIFAMSPTASAVVAGIGALTALFAATIGLRQYDIKKVLAYSTVSQLGYMFVAVGSGAYVAGIFHLVTHAFFKALLFLGAGAVIHAMHAAYHATHSHADAQDMRNMGGLRTLLPITWWMMLLATLAIAGIPPFSGFFSKDEILALAFARGGQDPIYYVVYAFGLLAALLTAIYMARLMAMTFLGSNRTGTEAQKHLHDSPPSMTLPLIVLGVLSVIGGAINLPHLVGGHQWLDRWLEPVLAPGSGTVFGQSLHLPEGSTEYLLVAIAVLVGIIGLVIGFRTTLARPVPTPEAAAPERGVARVLLNKYWVDELYDRVVVRPLVWVSRALLWKATDKGLIDGAVVNGSAWISRSVLGRAGSLLQNGQVGFYVIVFLVGALWILRVMAG
ncbi:MAG TPA: NADH-quinone oxidoreductase subunit L [Gemmatimonadales bacterium]|jgi:NADH-quinone oxidoreductase subunit L|nr:NADH-quinone oxidoreductase subunit L [Gemmatimonadales bacterium]